MISQNPGTLRKGPTQYEWASLFLSFLAIILSGVIFFKTQAENAKSAAEAAALQMCVTYTSGPAMRSLAERIAEGNRSFSGANAQPFMLGNDPSLEGRRYKNDLGAWVSFFDVVAAGTLRGFYDKEIIDSCFKDFFTVIGENILNRNIFGPTEFAEIRRYLRSR